MPSRKSALFSWLNSWTREERHGRLEAIYIAPSKGEPMQPLQRVQVLPEGLAGDRYALGTGYWIKTDGCAVTLTSQAALDRSNRRASGRFAQGEHRRNLVVSGIPLAAYRGHRVRIGEVVFCFHRLRPPCGYLERLLWRGAAKALGNAGGVCLHVEQPGVFQVGDAVELIAKV